MLTPIRPREATNQPWSAGSATASIGAVTGMADEVGQEHDRELDRAEVHAHDDDRRSAAERRPDVRLVVDVSRARASSRS